MEITIEKIFSFRYNANAVFENVCYDGFELTYFLNGKGYMSSNGEKKEYKANDILFSTPEYHRKLVCVESTNYLCIRFNCNPNIKYLSYGLYHCNNDIIFNLLKLIFTEYKEKPYKYFDFCNNKVAEILILLSREIKSNSTLDKSINDLINKIDNCLSFDMNISEMANMLSYNYDYFRQKFKSITGQSPSVYIANKRIENACKLLENNNYTCTEISNLCGFSSPSQFSRLFKQEIGISPLAYQKNIK